MNTTSFYAKDYVKVDTKTYYLLSELSITIFPAKGDTYNSILNEAGIQLYKKVLDMVNLKQFKDTLIQYGSYAERSGKWIPNRGSPFYESGGVFHVSNALRNKRIVGYRKSKKSEDPDDSILTHTSIIVFMTDEWAYTASGSLYKLER